MKVVVVESPAKAKTIEKYLGPGHRVLASFGHVRDLPAKDGSVEPDKDFVMHYEMSGRGNESMRAIATALKDADSLILATDPDREGEAISWHVLESLAQRKALKGVDIKRIVFNEITKSAVTQALKNPRDVDMDLVNAQQARRALDYLVGFTLSPLLWRKLPGAKSAGRVQSVALRLICERETEIEAFKAREYWTIDVDLGAGAQSFSARLAQVDGARLDKFDLANEAAARAIAARLNDAQFRVADVTVKPAKRHPAPPFTTSTLQQEASRKLGFSAKQAMQIAQRLYEGVDVGGEVVGLITYMRTDGVQMADEAITLARSVIGAEFGDRFVPEKPRSYSAKAKNAQEAHEAVRPTDFRRRPEDVRGRLDPDQFRLYELIWKRAIASQMESADFERTTVEVTDAAGKLGLRATGSVLLFAGFLKLYEEGADDRAGDEDANRLPKLAAGDKLTREAVRPEQHFTEPPPRYTEASLVKRLEELGIGRPSTYAAILEVLRTRGYARLDQKRFIPEDAGRLVTAFLNNFFDRYFTYDFTAQLEERLDDISGQRADWKTVLREFWRDFAKHGVEEGPDGKLLAVDEAIKFIDEAIGTRSETLRVIDEYLGPHFFPVREDGADPRTCPTCGEGRLGIKLGRMGAFIGCSRYPECRYTRPLQVGTGEAESGIAADGPVELGPDPGTGQMITLRKGPFGHYLQLGEPEGKEKPRRASIPKSKPLEEVDLAFALRMLALPREVGVHPESGKVITAGQGRFGPFLEHDGKYVRLASVDEAIEIGLNRAVTLIAEAAAKPGRGRQAGQTPLRVLGDHPEGGAVEVMAGRYGPYVRHGGVNATLPKEMAAEAITLEQALPLLAARAGAAKKPAAKKAAARKTAAKAEGAEAAPKKAAAKKAAPKKAAAKKAATPKAKSAA